MQILKKASDPYALAYLWIALELNYNILVLSKTDANEFIDALALFIPRYYTVLDLRKNRSIDLINFTRIADKRESNINRAKAVCAKFLPKKAEMAKENLIFSLMPDRILSNGDSPTSALFRFSKFGISFTTSISGNFRNRSIIKLLKSKPYQIRGGDINALDISILLDGDKNGLYISAITEYSWLERAEMRATDQAIIAKSFQNSRIAYNRALDFDNAKKSKLAIEYARANLLDVESINEEIEKRAEFINNIENRDTSVPNPIILYNEIK
jgi:hypothetical protein